MKTFISSVQLSIFGLSEAVIWENYILLLLLFRSTYSINFLWTRSFSTSKNVAITSINFLGE